MNLGSMVYNSYAIYANYRQGDYKAATENLGWLMIDCLSWGQVIRTGSMGIFIIVFSYELPKKIIPVGLREIF